MRKILGILLILTMVFSFAACGEKSGADEQSANDQIQKEETLNDVTGEVKAIKDAELTIKSDSAEEITFNIENAAIVSQHEIDKGDRAIVIYKGDISKGNTDQCEVIKVEDATEKIAKITGQVIKHSTDSITIKTPEGKKLAFNIKGAELRYENGIKSGNKVYISYTGQINGTDTSAATVHEVTDNAKNEHKEAVKVTTKKVDQTVYTTTIVNVRKGHSLSSDNIGTLGAGKELKRSGICSNGWSRVDHEGQIGYIASTYLTTKKPKKDTTKKESANKTEPTKKESSKGNEGNKGNKENSGKDDVKLMVCTIKNATMDAIQVNYQGNIYEFDTLNVKMHTVNGLLNGNTIEIRYKGTLKGTDTSNVKVISITDRTSNKEKAITNESTATEAATDATDYTDSSSNE